MDGKHWIILLYIIRLHVPWYIDRWYKYSKITAVVMSHTCLFPSECCRLSTGGLLPDHDLLVVAVDPVQPGDHQKGKPGPGVGSGGATINAVFVAIERMSAQLQHTTVSPPIIFFCYFLICHRTPCCCLWPLKTENRCVSSQWDNKILNYKVICPKS